MRRALPLVVLAATLASAAEPRLAALLDDGTLVVFRPREAGSRVVTVQNVGGSLIGIDRRPADGKLYGLTGSDVYRVDPDTGDASLVSTLTIPFDGDVRSGVDFTPQLDRLRLTSSDGRNLRVNVAIGATAADTPLAYAAGDPNAGTRPRITASGYGNNKADVATTTLFEIDSGLDVLVIQDPANDGTLKTVGPIGIDVADAAGMDVATDGQGKDHAWAAWGTTLHTIDLATGRATAVGPIPGATHPVISLAILDDLP